MQHAPLGLHSAASRATVGSVGGGGSGGGGGGSGGGAQQQRGGGGRGGRGSFVPGRPTQTKKEPLKFDSEYDFDAANEEFAEVTRKQGFHGRPDRLDVWDRSIKNRLKHQKLVNWKWSHIPWSGFWDCSQFWDWLTGQNIDHSLETLRERMPWDHAVITKLLIS